MRDFNQEAKLRRHGKLKQLVHEELSEIIRREVKDPRLHSLTITEVNLKPDNKSALIYVARLWEKEGEEISEEEKGKLMKGLKSASHFIYERLKKRLSLKVIPSLKFEYDFRLPDLTKIWSITNKL